MEEQIQMNVNDYFKYKKRVVVKIGSSSLQHPQTGSMNLMKIEKLVRELCDLRNQGMDVCLVSSGAIAVGRQAIGLQNRPEDISTKQACAAVGQDTMLEEESCQNAQNTFEEMFRLGIIPVVNENDTVSTYEMHFGDNDTLSAIVASLTGADLLILLSDIDGLYTDDPRKNPEATLVECVEKMDAHYDAMAKQSTGSDVGTGGMATKLSAARIATASGTDMIIANGKDVGIIHQIISGTFRGTLFRAQNDETFDIHAYLQNR